MFIISEEGRRCRWINRGLGGETVEGVGVMKDGELNLEEIESSHTRSGASRQWRGERGGCR